MFLDDETRTSSQGTTVVSRMIPGAAVTIPIREIYPTIDGLLQIWPRPFQARLEAGLGILPEYRLSVELSEEEGEALLGRLWDDMDEGDFVSESSTSPVVPRQGAE